MHFPMFIDLSAKKIIIIGAGNIAKRRISTLIMFTQNLVVIAPEVHKDIELMSKEYNFKILIKKYEQTDIQKSDIVVVATNDLDLNNNIYADCKALGIVVNVCSDQNKCDFYFPAVVRKDNLIIGITSSGQNHKLVKEFANKIRNI